MNALRYQHSLYIAEEYI